MPKTPPQLKNALIKTRRRLSRSVKRPISINELLAGQELQKAAVLVSTAQQWRDYLRGRLDPGLAEALVAVESRSAELKLLASEAGWAARLRFALPALLEAARARDPRIQRLSIALRKPGPGGAPKKL